MRNASCHKKRERLIKDVIRCYKTTSPLMRQGKHGLMIRVTLVDPGKYAACIQEHNPFIHRLKHLIDYYSKDLGFPIQLQIAKQSQFLMGL